MTSEVQPSSFVVDFMKRSDIVKLVREAESNSALRSRLDILVSIWHLAVTDNSRGKYVLKNGVDSVYNLARSSVDLENIAGEWNKWQKKQAHILADVKEKALTKKSNKKGFRVQERCHIEDVKRFEAAFSIEVAVILANLADVSSWYAWPKPRKELLLYHLDPEYGQSNQYTTVSSTKRATNDSADDSEECVKDRTAKRVCQVTSSSMEQQSISMPESGRIPDKNFLTGCAGVQHPVVQPTWTGNGKSCNLIYDGQFDIFESTDRLIHYRWSAISAIETMTIQKTLSTSSDIKWLYYNVDCSKINCLPFNALSQMIQRSELWKAEGKRGHAQSACLRLAFPRDLCDKNIDVFCRLFCIVPGAEAPEQDKY